MEKPGGIKLFGKTKYFQPLQTRDKKGWTIHDKK